MSHAQIIRPALPLPAASPLVTLQPGGRRAPLFLVHPVGGNVLCYCNLARKLGTERPFYGLQDRRLLEQRDYEIEIERMAADYIEAIRQVEEHGPYYLGGWSMGGIVAYEMARQLRAAGETTALLLLLDSPQPNRSNRQQPSSDAVMLKRFARDLGMVVDDDEMLRQLANAPLPQQLQVIAAQVSAGRETAAASDLTTMQTMYKVFVANSLAVRAYIPAPYDGTAVLIAARGGIAREMAAAASGWRELVRGGVREEIVPGNHFTILREPHVEFLAARLRRILDATGDPE